MIGIDTNILVALSVIEHENHEKIKNWLNKREDKYCTTLINVGEYLRLLTHPRVFSNPLAFKDASKLLSDLLEYYDFELLVPDLDWWKDGLKYIPDGISGNSVFDFQISYTFLSCGVHKIATFDRGFRRFDFLKMIII